MSCGCATAEDKLGQVVTVAGGGDGDEDRTDANVHSQSHWNRPPPGMEDGNEGVKYGLPWNYHFEIDKTIQRLKDKRAQRVALQFPEGLLMFATVIADVLERETAAEWNDFQGCEMVLLGDVTYGACCVDDYAAEALGCDFLVHYGHSCLISIKDCLLKDRMMYIFVEIDIDVRHFVDTVKRLIPVEISSSSAPTSSTPVSSGVDGAGAFKNSVKLNPKAGERVACVATIQFVSAMRAAVDMLNEEHFRVGEEGSPYLPIFVPQNRPLSKGELLGCTSPALPAPNANNTNTSPENTNNITTVLYVGDGRFHLESFLIANPQINAFQYDPYTKVLSKEEYNHTEMREVRSGAIEAAMGATSVGVIMGTLGRQGSARIIDRLLALLTSRKEGQEGGSLKSVFLFLMSEIFPSKLALLSQDCDVFFQVACPRLSIDWGYAFPRPLLSPYEAEVAMERGLGRPNGGKQQDTAAGNTDFLFPDAKAAKVEAEVNGTGGRYPMDHYSKAGGKWAVYTPK